MFGESVLKSFQLGVNNIYFKEVYSILIRIDKDSNEKPPKEFSSRDNSPLT